MVQGPLIYIFQDLLFAIYCLLPICYFLIVIGKSDFCYTYEEFKLSLAC